MPLLNGCRLRGYLGEKKNVHLSLIIYHLSLYYSSFITYHSITHHLSLKIPQLSKVGMFGTCFQLLITQKFLLFVGSMDWLGTVFTSYYLFIFTSTPNTQTHRSQTRASYFIFYFFFPSTPYTWTHQTQIELGILWVYIGDELCKCWWVSFVWVWCL